MEFNDIFLGFFLDSINISQYKRPENLIINMPTVYYMWLESSKIGLMIIAHLKLEILIKDS